MSQFNIFKNVRVNETEMDVQNMSSVISAPDVPNMDEKVALEAARLRMLKKRVNADSWTDELEDLMKAWGEKAAGYREMHMLSAQVWSKRSNNMYVPLLFFTTLGSVTTFSNLSSDSNTYLMGALGIMNISSALLASITKYYKPDEKAMNHKQIARSFGSFYRKVMLQLSMSREERQPADILTDWASTEYDRLQKDAPNVMESVITRYKDKHKSDKNKPDIVTDEFVIQVYPRK